MQFVSQFLTLKIYHRLGALLPNNRPFAASHSRGTSPPCWRTKVALGRYAFCLSCPSATFVLQHGGFVPRKLLLQLQTAYRFGVKYQVDGKFKNFSVYPQHYQKKHLTMIVPRISYTTEDVKQNKTKTKTNQSKSARIVPIFHEFLRNVYSPGVKTCLYNLLPSGNLDLVQIILATMV